MRNQSRKGGQDSSVRSTVKEAVHMGVGDKDQGGPGFPAHPSAVAGESSQPSLYAILRLVEQDGLPQTRHYHVPGSRTALGDAEFLIWLRQSATQAGLPVSEILALLVIHEKRDDAGLAREFSIERRRGAADGPFYGDPPRIEIIWPQESLRIYRIASTGALIEVATQPHHQPNRERTAEQLAGELQAVRDHLASDIQVGGCRMPSAVEELVGFDTIVCARLPDGSMVDCAVGWHRTIPFVVQAALPRFGVVPALSPEDEAAVQAFVVSQNLVRQETRLDEAGMAIVVRRRDQDELLLLRVRAGTATAEPYQRAPRALASADQARWMTYVESYEALNVLDAWRSAGSDQLLVISTDPDGSVWRHNVDPDGVETWRMLDEQLVANPQTATAPHDGAAANAGRVHPAPFPGSSERLAASPSPHTRVGRMTEGGFGLVGKGLPRLLGRSIPLVRSGDSIPGSANGRVGSPSVESPASERQ
jgi:hypothetical protein